MYRPVHTEWFERDVKQAKKDRVLYRRLKKKLREILENPEHFPPKRYDLKGLRSTHVGSFVIVFKIKGDQVLFLKFKHHDHAYE